MEKGLIHIYTGDGKGKTTAAIGISIRAKSSGLKTAFVQFFKERSLCNEIGLLNDIGIYTVVFDAVKSPFFNPGIDKTVIRKEVQNALSVLKIFFSEGTFDLLVLDEFICLMAEGILMEEEALEFLRGKPENMEIILTGNGCPDSLIEVADYVTFMKNIKHPYNKKMLARKGIEF